MKYEAMKHQGSKGARYIIVIQSVVCYNFSVVDNDNSGFYGGKEYGLNE